MKIGLGLYCSQLTTDHFRFARQAGATDIVAHLVDYRSEFPKLVRNASGTGYVWPRSQMASTKHLWTEEELRDLKAAIEAEGLRLAAVENFDPCHWHDVLLDGPRKREQLEDLKTMIHRVGKVGIPIIGYDFSVAGVWGHVVGPFARAGAESVAFLGPDGPPETPIPSGQVWNMTYDADAPPGTVGTVTSDQLWQRLADFLNAVLPVAEEAGVRLAAHPDDPPMPTIRGTARLVYQPHHYRRLLAINASPASALEFCMGPIQEMTDGSLYETLHEFSAQGRIGYVHLRNIVGKVPRYHEVFIDEGDIDVIRALRILHKNGYDGVLIPDHTPQMCCAAPWHAGSAYALGYMRAAIEMIEQGA
ncbi:MAG: mannonate dehydratase [Planctomycetes bacterium]|nr:mannonate dehydratase [Planctomycetota bacterium]